MLNYGDLKLGSSNSKRNFSQDKKVEVISEFINGSSGKPTERTSRKNSQINIEKDPYTALNPIHKKSIIEKKSHSAIHRAKSGYMRGSG